MASLLLEVKAKMAIYSHQKTRSLLEGEYGSVFKGRSMDFDDLREYIAGDDVKDIDWRATARSGQTLIRRYIAIRKHNILLVVDTGKNMRADSSHGDSKRDIAVMAAGAVGSLALQHGDLVGSVSGTSQHSTYIPLKGSKAHLERILQRIKNEVDQAATEGSIVTQLEYIARSIRQRMIVVVVSDTPPEIAQGTERLLRRLRAQHEVLWLSVDELDPTDIRWDSLSVYDQSTDARVPELLRTNKKLQAELKATRSQALSTLKHSLERSGIQSASISAEAEVMQKLYILLERHRYAGR